MFDDKNRILIDLIGKTDSIFYKYDIIKDYVISNEFLKFNLNEKNQYKLSYTDTQNIKNNYNKNYCLFTDTFNLFKEENFDEIVTNFKSSMNNYILNTDSGYINKYSFKIGTQILLDLHPYGPINCKSWSDIEIIDSLILYCYYGRLIKEEFYFKNETVIKNNFYKDCRLIKTILYAINPNKNKENDFINIYKYRTVDSYNDF